MAKATYYFGNGTASLSSVPVDAAENGDLTHAGSGQVVVTGAKASDAPASGCYVLDADAAEAEAQLKAEADAKAAAEAEAKVKAEAEADAKSKAKTKA